MQHKQIELFSFLEMFLYLCNAFASCSEGFAIFFRYKKMSGRFSRTIYVGNLPADIRESKVEDLFYKVCFNCFHVKLILLVSRIMRFIQFKLIIFAPLSLLLISELIIFSHY